VKRDEHLAEVPQKPKRRGCVHHWMLQEPANGKVVGRCNNCNSAKTFPAAPDSTQRFDDYRELTATSAYLSRSA
jgi:hypothetical protein